MKIRVHNAKEAGALTKEWNRSGQNAGENIEFVSHETDEQRRYGSQILRVVI